MNDITSIEQVLVRLFDTPGYQWLVVLVALAAGAAHALAPGHGKSIAAAYLVGAHGRVSHAAWLGFVVAAMHTFSAIVLALLWHGLRAVLPFEMGGLTAGMQIAAALIVVAVGIALVRRGGHGHAHQHAPAPEHAHAHAHSQRHSHDDHHSHDHDHGPGHHHGHSHADPAHNPFTRKGLIALGLSGGLVPSPTVFLILISGLVTGKVAFAVLLVLVFGVGMMVTITAVGVLTLTGMGLVRGGSDRWQWLSRASVLLPRVAAWAVIVLGLTYLTLGVRGLMA